MNTYVHVFTPFKSVSSSLHLFIDLAPFDTIDHIFFSRLQISFGISGLALAWFHSYLEGRSQFAIAHIGSSYGLLQQQYADDTLLYVVLSKDNYDTPVAKLELCLSTLHTWFCYNRLALNTDKSEAIVFGTTQRSRSLPVTSTVNVAGTFVQVSNQVRILGVILEKRLLFDAHISTLSKSCFYRIRALHIHPNLTLDCSKNITCSLVGCRLDYANSTLVAILVKTISRL